MTTQEIDLSTFEELRKTSDADFLRELVATFLEEAPKLLLQLRSSLRAGDVETFRRAAHSLKSNGATFGASRFSLQARELELLARENKLPQTGTGVEDLETMFSKVAAELKVLSS